MKPKELLEQFNIIKNKTLEITLNNIARDLKEQYNGNLYYVGGTVRDAILDIDNNDVDIAVEGVDFNTLKNVLDCYCTKTTSEPVGNTFAVVKASIMGFDLDFALCRTEKKIGKKHQDFELNVNATIEEDLSRRDLTINAIAVNVLTNKVINPFNGVYHLKKGIADYPTTAFAEDPLRVLRVGRFMSRFDLLPTARLFDLCKTLQPTNISAERIGMELWKTMKQAKTPSTFFEFLDKVNWLWKIFPELASLKKVPQSPKWHPEGDVFVHTMHCIDYAKTPFQRIVLLCHDLGKASTTALNKRGDWSAYGHEKASVPLADTMLSNVKLELVDGFGGRKRIEQVLLLCELHMYGHLSKLKDEKLIKLIRRLNKFNLSFSDLMDTCEADSSGRPPHPKGKTKQILEFERRYNEFYDKGIFTPIVTGKMLIECGVKEGEGIGKLLIKAQNLQDSGKLTKENWKKLLKL